MNFPSGTDRLPPLAWSTVGRDLSTGSTYEVRSKSSRRNFKRVKTLVLILKHPRTGPSGTDRWGARRNRLLRPPALPSVGRYLSTVRGSVVKFSTKFQTRKNACFNFETPTSRLTITTQNYTNSNFILILKFFYASLRFTFINSDTLLKLFLETNTTR